MIKKLLCAGIALSVFLLLAFSMPARAQSTKLTLDAEINTNWPDNTSGAITPALLRSTVTDIVASYVDWLVCTAQGGIVYWNSAAAPTCLLAGTSGQFLKTQGAGANPTWAAVAFATGSKALTTTAITSTNCSAAQTVTVSGLLTPDVINWSFSGDPTGVTGYTPATAGGLQVRAYPTADTVNFKICNPTVSTITPGSITLNWQVIR